jgi:hypothetical protein
VFLSGSTKRERIGAGAAADRSEFPATGSRTASPCPSSLSYTVRDGRGDGIGCTGEFTTGSSARRTGARSVADVGCRPGRAERPMMPAPVSGKSIEDAIVAPSENAVRPMLLSEFSREPGCARLRERCTIGTNPTPRPAGASGRFVPGASSGTGSRGRGSCSCREEDPGCRCG